MKTFTEFMQSLREAVTGDDDDQEISEQTVHLVPHGGRGTHFKVVKGIPGQLEAGEVIHDSHVDDLHDIGIKTKILKEDELDSDERAIFEAEDVTELPFDDSIVDDLPSFSDIALDESEGRLLKVGDSVLHHKSRAKGIITSIDRKHNHPDYPHFPRAQIKTAKGYEDAYMFALKKLNETKALDFDTKERNRAIRKNNAADRRKDKDGFGRIGKSLSEDEQIDELSDNLMSRYRNKSLDLQFVIRTQPRSD